MTADASVGRQDRPARRLLAGPAHAQSGVVATELGKVDVAPLMQCGIAVRTVARKLVAYIRQPGITSKAINQTRKALPSEAVAFCAANLKKMKGAFKIAEST